MVQALYRKNHYLEWGITLFVMGIVLTNSRFAYGHGGKTHAEIPFSVFEAVQKATELYDRLITSGKLPAEWETTLSTIHVSVRYSDNSLETICKSAENPRTNKKELNMADTIFQRDPP